MYLRTAGPPEDVSDVFQDSIIVLYNQISDNNLNLSTDLKGYFFGIAQECLECSASGSNKKQLSWNMI